MKLGQLFFNIGLILLTLTTVRASEQSAKLSNLFNQKPVIEIIGNHFVYNGVRFPMGGFEGKHPIFEALGKETSTKDSNGYIWENIGIEFYLLRADNQCALALKVHLEPVKTFIDKNNQPRWMEIHAFPGDIFIEGMRVNTRTNIDKVNKRLKNKFVPNPVFGLKLSGNEYTLERVYLGQRKGFLETKNLDLVVRLEQGEKACDKGKSH